MERQTTSWQVWHSVFQPRTLLPSEQIWGTWNGLEPLILPVNQGSLSLLTTHTSVVAMMSFPDVIAALSLVISSEYEGLKRDMQVHCCIFSNTFQYIPIQLNILFAFCDCLHIASCVMFSVTSAVVYLRAILTW